MCASPEGLATSESRSVEALDEVRIAFATVTYETRMPCLYGPNYSESGHVSIPRILNLGVAHSVMQKWTRGEILSTQTSPRFA